MKKISELNRELTDLEALYVARVLRKYVRTQLSEIRDVIDNTIEYYKANSSPKFRNDNKIELAGLNTKMVAIPWQFKGDVNKKLKDKNLVNKYKLSWQSTDKGAWILRVEWNNLEGLVKEFQDIGLDCFTILSLKNSSTLKKKH